MLHSQGYGFAGGEVGSTHTHRYWDDEVCGQFDGPGSRGPHGYEPLWRCTALKNAQEKVFLNTKGEFL